MDAADIRPGQHFALLGADGHGKAEMTAAAVDRCRLFCDEWRQASTGGELAGPVSRGQVARGGTVTDLGAVLDGEARGRDSVEETTLFDSTGLAIQDLAIAVAVVEALGRGDVEAELVSL